jgi:hypothetical protein
MSKPMLVWIVCGFLSACASSSPPVTTETDTARIEMNGAKSLFSGDSGVMETSTNSELPASTTESYKKAPVNLKKSHKETNPKDYSGLSYWIERHSSQGMQQVTSSTSFLSNDRIRLHIKANRSGYLYVVNQGTSGLSSYLFPASDGDSEYIEANRTYIIPAHGGFIRFDNRPGQEIVWIFLSQYPLPSSIQTNFKSNTTPSLTAAPYNPCGGKDLLLENPANLQTSCGVGSKDLLVEDDSAQSYTPNVLPLQPAEYAVAPEHLFKQGRIMALRVALRHE